MPSYSNPKLNTVRYAKTDKTCETTPIGQKADKPRKEFIRQAVGTILLAELVSK